MHPHIRPVKFKPAKIRPEFCPESEKKILFFQHFSVERQKPPLHFCIRKVWAIRVKFRP